MNGILRRGILLVNLGSPYEPKVGAIRKFLREFLMDPYVLKMPWLFRAALVYGIILPFRPKKTLHNYLAIWRNEGSPLIIESLKLQKKMALASTGRQVEMAMRYGSPSIENALENFRKNNVSQISVIPLYPQFALSSTQTTIEKIKSLNQTRYHQFFNLTFVEDFFNNALFIEALAEKAEKTLAREDYDHFLVSFHGLPKNHLGPQVQSSICNFGDCCKQVSKENSKCYRAQCFETARLLTQKLNIPTDKWSVSFQSRLTRGWIEPFTDHVIEQMPSRGIKKLAVICPSFVTDCLETLEEINRTERARFFKAGGEKFYYVECLNDSDLWIKTLQELVISSSKHGDHF